MDVVQLDDAVDRTTAWRCDEDLPDGGPRIDHAAISAVAGNAPSQGAHGLWLELSAHATGKTMARPNRQQMLLKATARQFFAAAYPQQSNRGETKDL